MGENTRIEWTHHTFNPWRGCSKVSPGCEHCYAERDSKRNPKVLGTWGPKGTRPVASEDYWRKPLRWEREARAAGERRRVFCASIADVFEDREDLDRARARLFGLIRVTPSLDWLLLTKRPESVRTLLGRAWNVSPSVAAPNIGAMMGDWLDGRPPENLWLGVSVESRDYLWRVALLMDLPARVRFISAEPLLDDLVEVKEGLGNLGKFLHKDPRRPCPVECYPFLGTKAIPDCDFNSGQIDWVIVGGESGPDARPMHPIWPRKLRDLCTQLGVAFHFKQWGEWSPVYDFEAREHLQLHADGRMKKGLLPDHSPGWCVMNRVGKDAAGRLLDGVTWDQFPAVKEKEKRNVKTDPKQTKPRLTIKTVLTADGWTTTVIMPDGKRYQRVMKQISPGCYRSEGRDDFEDDDIALPGCVLDSIELSDDVGICRFLAYDWEG